MPVNIRSLFLALVIVQAMHSTEEYVFRLYDTFPPTRFLLGLLSTNPQQSFLVLNVCFVLFGMWCYFWPIRRNWHSAIPIAWLWVCIEIANGVLHPTWSIMQRDYTPGVATAILLLPMALFLAFQLIKQSRKVSNVVQDYTIRTS